MAVATDSTTQTASVPSDSPVSYPSSGHVWAGALLAMAVIVLYFAQVAWAMLLITPWYLPLGGTGAAILVLYALSRRRTWGRVGIAIVCVALAMLEWLFVLAVTVLPAYQGPIKQGSTVPAFHAFLADGTDIRESYFRQNSATVVVFFQGRWCPFCRTQLRELEAEHEIFDRLGAKVLAVSIEGADEARQTQRDFPGLVIVSDAKRELSNAVELISRGTAPDGSDCAIPTILLVDKSGTVRWLHRPTRFVARPSASELAALIHEHIVK